MSVQDVEAINLLQSDQHRESNMDAIAIENWIIMLLLSLGIGVVYDCVGARLVLIQLITLCVAEKLILTIIGYQHYCRNTMRRSYAGIVLCLSVFNIVVFAYSSSIMADLSKDGTCDSSDTVFRCYWIFSTYYIFHKLRLLYAIYYR
jgi:hypothetical protein